MNATPANGPGDSDGRPAVWALDLEKSLNIRGLAATLCGPAVAALTADGWEFAGVVRGDAMGAGLAGEF